MQHHCLKCETVTEHWHLHDTAHGIPDTHMAGSERFTCKVCKRSTFAHSPDAGTFKFVLDGHEQRAIGA